MRNSKRHLRFSFHGWPFLGTNLSRYTNHISCWVNWMNVTKWRRIWPNHGHANTYSWNNILSVGWIRMVYWMHWKYVQVQKNQMCRGRLKYGKISEVYWACNTIEYIEELSYCCQNIDCNFVPGARRFFITLQKRSVTRKCLNIKSIKNMKKFWNNNKRCQHTIWLSVWFRAQSLALVNMKNGEWQSIYVSFVMFVHF